MSHHHLTRDERVTLASLLRAGESQAECAQILGVHRSTILRELRRSPKEYKVFIANKNALNCRKGSKHTKRKIENDKKLEKKIVELLKIGRSPEQISEEVKRVSDETIYTWVERSRKDLAVLLPQRGRKRHIYGKIPRDIQGWTKLVKSIETRPKVVETRSRVGDWEGDTIVGRDRARLLVHVDRRSRFIAAKIIPSGEADITHISTVASLKKFPCHTITYDRGSEFALWRLIEKDTGAMHISLMRIIHGSGVRARTRTVYFEDSFRRERRSAKSCEKKSAGQFGSSIIDRGNALIGRRPVRYLGIVAIESWIQDGGLVF